MDRARLVLFVSGALAVAACLGPGPESDSTTTPPSEEAVVQAADQADAAAVRSESSSEPRPVVESEVEAQLAEVRRQQARLEEALQRDRTTSLASLVACDWIFQRHGTEANEAAVALLATLLGDARRLCRGDARLAVQPWSDQWLVTSYEADGDHLALAWIVSADGPRLGAIGITRPDERCCGQLASAQPGMAHTCGCCRVPVHRCTCPRSLSAARDLVLPEDWERACCIGRRTHGRALCQGCAKLLAGAPIGDQVKRWRRRLSRRRQRSAEVLTTAGQLAGVLSELDRLPAARRRLTQGAAELRQALNLFGTHASRSEQLLLDRPPASLEAALLALDEPILRTAESHLVGREQALRELIEQVGRDARERLRSGDTALAAVLEVSPSAGSEDSVRQRLPAGLHQSLSRALERAAAEPPPAVVATRLRRTRAPDEGELLGVVASSRAGRQADREGWAALQVDDVPRALAAFGRAVHLLPIDESARRGLAETFHLQSLARLGEQRYEAAAESATRALRYAPASSWILCDRAYCRRRLGDLRGSAEDLLLAAGMGNQQARGDLFVLAELLNRRAWRNHAAGETDAALRDWRWARELETRARGQTTMTTSDGR